MARPPAGPTWTGDRRLLENGVPNVALAIVSADGAILVTGAGTGVAAPLVPALHAAANLAVRNAPDAPALEVHGEATLAVFGTVLGVGLDDLGILTLAPPNELTVGRGRARVRYVALAGGVDLMGAGMGARVPVGAAVRPGQRPGVRTDIPGRVDLRPDEPLRVLPADADGVAALCAHELHVGDGGDRSVVRLHAPDTLRRALQSRRGSGGPVGLGAVVITPAGELAVIGPDHPPASAYPRVAQVHPSDVVALLARAEGAPVKFVAA